MVDVDDTMTFVMWAKYFFDAKTKDLPENFKLKHLSKHNLIEQDDTSAIQLKQNGKHSSTRQTKHIDIIRCFYVTDKVTDETVEMTYKKTTDILSNYLTK